MKRTTLTVWLFVAALTLCIFGVPSVTNAQGHMCGGGHGSSDGSTHGSGHEGHDGTLSSEEIPFAPVVEGVQTATVVVTSSGYKPERLRLRAGVPARILFDQRASGQCPSQVQIPLLGIEKTDLPNGVVTVVSFTPERNGSYPFTCGMKMLTGTIIVGE